MHPYPWKRGRRWVYHHHYHQNLADYWIGVFQGVWRQGDESNSHKEGSKTEGCGDGSTFEWREVALYGQLNWGRDYPQEWKDSVESHPRGLLGKMKWQTKRLLREAWENEGVKEIGVWYLKICHCGIRIIMSWRQIRCSRCKESSLLSLSI